MAAPLVAAILPELVGAGRQIINKFFPDPAQAAEAELELLKLAQQARQGQLEINRVEAAHRSIWVAGWRPYIGWACGSAIVYSYILRDFLIIGLRIADIEVPDLPVIDLDDLWPVLLGLLGLGALRTSEKIKGAAK